ncbi:tail fiber domain-containing protein [Burkholderia sp. 22PA0099]|uniref:tail fiber domain-containing protein n=1 Tax=Burkholderia sp. 22PA0099 TaxID=3237372 RepID=UPI0039C04C2F
MTALVQINQGTPPTGSDGDTVRVGFSKVNANTAALSAQVPLVTAYVSDTKALDASYVGKRVCLNFGAAGGKVTFPAAATVPADGCILLWNIGLVVAIGLQGQDGTEVTMLNAGDWALYVSDGSGYWHVQQRGRNTWNEIVGGSLEVQGNFSVDGVMSVPGAGGQGTIRLGPNEGYFYGTSIAVGWFSSTKGGFYYALENKTFSVPNLSVDGALTAGARPTYAGNLAWDAGNLPHPVTSADSHAYGFSWNGSNIYAYVDGSPVGGLAFASDYRIKKSVETFEGAASDAIKALRPVTYQIADVGPFKGTGAVELGFIAHELKGVIPSAVDGEKDAVDAEGKIMIQSLKWPPIVAMLTKALQEALARIEALEAAKQ